MLPGSDFLAALQSPKVQATLFRAKAIVDSENFPPAQVRQNYP
jgi:hypothetical protein